MPKRQRRRTRDERQAKATKRARRSRRQREQNLKKALGIPTSEILPHLVGRRPWRGFRDSAPEENGPVRVKKIE